MTETESRGACDACGLPTRPDNIALTLWTAEGLVVVEDVPAEVCEACSEHYYDDDTQSDLRRLASGGFATKDAVRTMSVPVYSLVGRRTPNEAMEELA